MPSSPQVQDMTAAGRNQGSHLVASCRSNAKEAMRHHGAMTVLDELAARICAELADVAAVLHPHAVVIPGDRGDRLVVDLQQSPGSHGHTTLFFVNLALCPVPWVAWLKGSTLEQARTLPPDAIGNLLWDRLDPTAFGPCWQVTAGELDAVVDTLTPALRSELTQHWLPLLPRDALRERIRSGGPLPGAGLSGRNAQIAQLLCAIEDMPAAERAELVAYFRRRQADGVADLGELADWLGTVTPA